MQMFSHFFKREEAELNLLTASIEYLASYFSQQLSQKLLACSSAVRRRNGALQGVEPLWCRFLKGRREKSYDQKEYMGVRL